MDFFQVGGGSYGIFCSKQKATCWNNFVKFSLLQKHITGYRIREIGQSSSKLCTHFLAVENKNIYNTVY